MIRLATLSVGIVSASITAVVESATAAPPNLMFLWSAVAGIAGAGVTYGVLTNKVNAAHARITVEKCDREKAISDLKADVTHGFDSLREDLREQTRTVIEALRK
jgi:hypothetical protein